MEEYQILSGYAKDVQMRLNQWRHDYYIHIEGFQVRPTAKGDVCYFVLLTRTKKEELSDMPFKPPIVCRGTEIPEGKEAKSDRREDVSDSCPPWEE